MGGNPPAFRPIGASLGLGARPRANSRRDVRLSLLRQPAVREPAPFIPRDRRRQRGRYGSQGATAPRVERYVQARPREEVVRREVGVRGMPPRFGKTQQGRESPRSRAGQGSACLVPTPSKSTATRFTTRTLVGRWKFWTS